MMLLENCVVLSYTAVISFFIKLRIIGIADIQRATISDINSTC